MKKIINAPENVVNEMCKGMVRAHPELEYDEHYKIIKKKAINKNKVTLISGGGSGHEPAHAGFVGRGMLDAAVCGDVFASPSQVQIFNAIKQTASEKGTILIVKNYSGDVLNFNNAAGLARDYISKIKVEPVYVNDDIAVRDSLYTVGRRGVAGTVLVQKVMGALAEKGGGFWEVYELGNKAISSVKSFGFALTSCTVPSKGTPTFTLLEDEMEYGVGIHGEPGRSREKIVSADKLASKIVKDLITELRLKKGDEVCLLINGFGASPISELYLFNNSVSKVLEENNISIYKTMVGNFMTSLDMAGASVSIMKLDDELKEMLDYPVYTPALKSAATGKVARVSEKLEVGSANSSQHEQKMIYTNDNKAVFGDKTLNTTAVIELIDKMGDIIIANEVHFCDMDSVAGDGDFGASIAKGFSKLKELWPSRKKENIGAFLDSVGEVIMEYCGGASGPLWGSAIRGAAKVIGDITEIDLAGFAKLLDGAIKAIQLTGERSFGRGAVVGDKTMIDALIPSYEALNAAAQAGDTIKVGFRKAADAAKAGSDATKDIAARMGRAGVVGERSIGHPDAGAYGIAVIFDELAKYVESKKK